MQITSDPRMPIGMSRGGSLASCAEVEAASKLMKAKKHDRGTAWHSAEAEAAERAGVFGDERVPVGGIDVLCTQHDGCQNHGQIDGHHDVV
ncbi:hypothetical protein [Rhodopila sp.]|uniref:hypothetical protein n=1 Tax=Rhodopila sp. TaxID=2480087 RepID=UPI003D109C6A